MPVAEPCIRGQGGRPWPGASIIGLDRRSRSRPAICSGGQPALSRVRRRPSASEARSSCDGWRGLFIHALGAQSAKAVQIFVDRGGRATQPIRNLGRRHFGFTPPGELSDVLPISGGAAASHSVSSVQHSVLIENLNFWHDPALLSRYDYISAAVCFFACRPLTSRTAGHLIAPCLCCWFFFSSCFCGWS